MSDSNHRTVSTGKVTFVYAPEVQIELQREIHLHPPLLERLAAQEDTSFEAQLATVCTFAGVEIDGYFNPQELAVLMNILISRLRAIRTIVVH